MKSLCAILIMAFVFVVATPCIAEDINDAVGSDSKDHQQAFVVQQPPPLDCVGAFLSSLSVCLAVQPPDVNCILNNVNVLIMCLEDGEEEEL